MMPLMKKDDLLQLFLLALTASGFGAATALLLRTGFKSEDVFAFSGAIVGAAGTVLGAAWLADRAANREKREEQSLIRAELITLLDVAESTTKAFPAEGPWPDHWRSSAHTMFEVADGVCRFLDEVINYAKTLNFHQREEIKLVRAQIPYFMQFYTNVMSPDVDPWPDDERTWLGVIQGVIFRAKAALATFAAT